MAPPRSTTILSALATSCMHEADAEKVPLTFNTFVTSSVHAGSWHSSDPDGRTTTFESDMEERRIRDVEMMHVVKRSPLSHHGSNRDVVEAVADAVAVKEAREELVAGAVAVVEAVVVEWVTAICIVTATASKNVVSSAGRSLMI